MICPHEDSLETTGFGDSFLGRTGSRGGGDRKCSQKKYTYPLQRLAQAAQEANVDDSQSIEETQMDDDDEGVRILSSVDVTFRILFWYPESTNASLEGFSEKEIQFGTHSRCVFCLFSTLPCLFVFSRTQLPFLQKLSEIMWNLCQRNMTR